MVEPAMTIDGESVSGGPRFPVVDPATGEPFSSAPDCSRAELDRAVPAAAAAFHDWSRDEEARRVCLREAVRVLKENLGEIATLLTAEQGKPLEEARIEVLGARAWLRYFAELERPVEVIQDDARARIEVRREPIGVTAALTAWNFPLTLLSWKLGPSLLAGNTVVVKPSPFTPLSTLLVGSLLAEVMPPGVVNVVSGGDELGVWLCGHEGVRKVSFTGSVVTGKSVAGAAAEDLKRLTLELGGNDAAILLDDVDVGAIAERLFWGAFINAGQTCAAVKRVYAPESIYEAVVEALAAIAAAVKVGAGNEEGVRIGPLNNPAQRSWVESLVADAVAGGGRVAAGGAPLDRPGYFFAPTVVADVADGCALVDEEQFGPALPVVRYRDVDAAVAAANGTKYGLGGSVWGTDLERARSVAARLECGSTWINTHTAVQPDQPFGGLKWSGVGVENGPWGVDAFTELRVVHEHRVPPRPD